jgi:cyclomaltodextrinase / maltogenic alpha-amylase / neopullulanase
MSSNFIPEWAKHAVWYQIFPERFANGDPSNDPDLASLHGSSPHHHTQPWQIHPWTSDWYALQPYERQHQGEPVTRRLVRRRYGGDLQGVLDRLNYLQDLGVTALYLNPCFQSPSLHKYDGATYHHIDPHFGPDPQGDLRLIAAETPHDPASWVWTAADRLMLDLIAEVHRRGMRLILDGVFNHMGVNSWAFQDVIRNRQNSPYKDWFKILDWHTPSAHAPFTYQGWSGVSDLPELNQDENGITAGPKAYIFDITRRWMDPDGDGDPGDGLDGWRLDVAFCIRHPFWKDWRRHVKSINPDAYLVAEIVFEDPNEDYLQGDEFDAVMNYAWGFAYAGFFAQTQNPLSASHFVQTLHHLRELHPAGVAYGMQNLLDSHDTARIASQIVNRDLIYYPDWEESESITRLANNPSYDTRKPNAEERLIHKLMALFQMTDIGAPMIYYGDETGMWGANDPCCRKPMLWREFEYEPERVLPDGSPRPAPDEVAFDEELHDTYRHLIHLRNSLPALQVGDFITLLADDERRILAFSRQHGDQRAVVALNNSPAPQGVRLPLHGTWMDRLEGDQPLHAGADGLDLLLPPYWGVILTPPY